MTHPQSSFTNFFRTTAFTSRGLNLVESFSFFLERLRPNAERNFQTLTQSLFERPTFEAEIEIAKALRLPYGTTTACLAKNRLHNARFEKRRTIVECAARVQNYCEGLQVPQRDDYLDLIRNDPRSRIIASFHYGDFLYGSAGLFSLHPRNRKTYVLSLNKASNACHENLAAGFKHKAPGPECELLLSETSSTELSQKLRAGNTSLLLFCDVPGGLNKTTDAVFLSRRAWFSIGPAVLALANRVPLLPIVNYSHRNSNYLCIGSQIEPILLPGETLKSGARRLTQHLVSFFELVFLEHPEQWRFLSLLPHYFSKQ